MSQMTQEEFDNISFQVVDPEPDRIKKEKSDTRRFWFLSVPLGALIGFGAAVLSGSGMAFWVVGFVAVILIQNWLEGV